MRRWSWFVVLSLVLWSLTPAPAMALTLRQRNFLKEINRIRTTRGYEPLRLDRTLSRLAKDHARRMVERGELFHSDLHDVATLLSDWQVLGENIGAGWSPEDLVRAWMRSPAHRRNLLDERFERIGIGGIRRPDGSLWMSLLFYG